MNSKIRIGIIGYDHWYWAFGLTYSFCLRDDVEVVGIWDRIPERAQKIAEAYHISKTYPEIDSLLADDEIDAVVITTPTSEQPKIVAKAVKAKKHLLLGKPLARTLREADEIIDNVRKAGVKAVALASGELDAKPIKELVDQANIGKICAVHFSTYAVPPMSEPGNMDPGWFVDPEKAAGGGFIDHAIYGASILRYLLDDDIESVYAQIDKYALKELEVEDYGAAIMRFKNGTIAFLEGSIWGYVSDAVLAGYIVITLPINFRYTWPGKENSYDFASQVVA
jgi:predicted dehydrogenase